MAEVVFRFRQLKLLVSREEGFLLWLKMRLTHQELFTQSQEGKCIFIFFNAHFN